MDKQKVIQVRGSFYKYKIWKVLRAFVFLCKIKRTFYFTLWEFCGVSPLTFSVHPKLEMACIWTVIIKSEDSKAIYTLREATNDYFSNWHILHIFLFYTLKDANILQFLNKKNILLVKMLNNVAFL